MAGIFDFAPNTHVAEELPPDEAEATSFNGWDFTSRPGVPYRAKFKLTMSGMYWHMLDGQTGLDLYRDPQHNAGLLLEFYRQNRRWDTFSYPHEFYGNMLCRFAAPVQIPKAIPNSNGLITDFEITLVHHNPSF